MIEHLVLLDGAHHVVPVDVGEEHVLVDVHLLQKLVAYSTHLAEHLARACFECQSLAEDVVVGCFCHYDTGIYTQTGEYVHDVSLKFVERSLLVGVSP